MSTTEAETPTLTPTTPVDPAEYQPLLHSMFDSRFKMWWITGLTYSVRSDVAGVAVNVGYYYTDPNKPDPRAAPLEGHDLRVVMTRDPRPPHRLVATQHEGA